MKPTLDLTHFQDREDKLPSFSPLVVKLLQALEDIDIPTDALGDLVQSDGPLTIRIITAANSALFSGYDPAQDLIAAINRLGRKQLRTLVLATTLFDVFEGTPAPFPQVDYWRRAAANGIVCELIAYSTNAYHPSRAWLVGILQHIGRLLFATQAPLYTGPIFQLARERHLSFDEAAGTLYGITSSSIGAWACARWGLPSYLVEHLRDQVAQPPSSSPLAAIAQVADHVCHLHGISMPGDYQNHYQNEANWNQLGINVPAFITLYRTAEPKLQELDELMLTLAGS